MCGLSVALAFLVAGVVSLSVLILPRHAPQAASCRHRFMQYLPYLESHGIHCEVSPFFDEQYTAAVLDAGAKQWWRFAGSFARRLGALSRARRFDLVVVHAEFVPFAPFAIERWLAALGRPYIVDFDDAFFHTYDRHPSFIVRGLLAKKLGSLMRGAALNIAGSDYLADYARRFSERVALVPTVVDLARYPVSSVEPPRGRFRIGWIGSPATTPHLQSVAVELSAFAAGRDVELVAIGARPFDSAGLPVQFMDWSERTEVQELAGTNVGIMPLPDSPWARGKCGFKLIQAMACWRPVVASPVGANCRIVENGVSGLLVEPGDWGTALRHLYDDPTLARTMGIAGRRAVEREYALQVWAPRMAALWSKAARRQALKDSSHEADAPCAE